MIDVWPGDFPSPRLLIRSIITLLSLFPFNSSFVNTFLINNCLALVILLVVVVAALLRMALFNTDIMDKLEELEQQLTLEVVVSNDEDDKDDCGFNVVDDDNNDCGVVVVIIVVVVIVVVKEVESHAQVLVDDDLGGQEEDIEHSTLITDSLFPLLPFIALLNPTASSLNLSRFSLNVNTDEPLPDGVNRLGVLSFSSVFTASADDCKRCCCCCK